MKNNKGTIIIFVVVIVAIVGILYSSVYILLGIENKNSQSLMLRTKAYYVAESGLERGVAIVKQQDVDVFSTFFPFDLTNPFSPDYKETHQCNVTLTLEQAGEYKIQSVGTCKNVKRILEAVVNKSEDDFSIQSWKEVN